MTKKNKYYNRSRISEVKFREIIKYFSLDLNATQITKLTNLNRNTINKILCLARQRILLISQLQSVPLVGQIEVDESYFGARIVKGKRGRGARGKTIVFGLLKRGDKVYTQIIKKCDRATLHAIIKEKTSTDILIVL
jgi:transposase